MLKPICLACGFENEEDDIFCGGCGRDLRKNFKTPVHMQEVKAPITPGIPESRTLNIDISKVLYTEVETEAKQAKEDKEIDQPEEESKEEQKQEDSGQLKMSQQAIERLFKEKAKDEERQDQRETDVEDKSEKKEPVGRYVDKNSPSVLDAPISQDELDRLLEDYKKKHGC